MGTRTYGHSAKGTQSVQVIRKHDNKTLSMLVSLEGPVYHNMVHGGTNTARFLQFFEEACEAANIQIGDIVVMDNLSAHHYEGVNVSWRKVLEARAPCLSQILIVKTTK